MQAVRSRSRCTLCPRRPRCPGIAPQDLARKGSRLPHRRRSPPLGSPSSPQRPSPEAAKRPVPDPLTQDVRGGGVHDPQAVHRGNLPAGDYPVPTIHINGDDFSVVIGFNLCTYVPLVYFLAEPGRLFTRAAPRRCDSFSLSVRRALCVPHACPFAGIRPRVTLYCFVTDTSNDKARTLGRAVPRREL